MVELVVIVELVLVAVLEDLHQAAAQLVQLAQMVAVAVAVLHRLTLVEPPEVLAAQDQ
tara:strand:+ start:332 stop:505 length:174 start_codon:yes stop_codon:yes gene_type:complete